MANCHYLSQRSKGHVYTVEIKPKAFRAEKVVSEVRKKVEEDKELLKECPSVCRALLNDEVMEFDLKQVQKVLKGDEKYFTNYSPANLFSNDKIKMLRALKDLRACPQCNLRMYKDGKKIVYMSDDLLKVVVEILMQTKVLDCIKEAQAVTDKNIEDIYTLYTAKCKSMPHSQQIIETVMPHCLSPAPFAAHEQSWAEVLKYLFSMSARDCSVMATFCLDEEGKELGKDEVSVDVEGRKYVAKVRVIDFDVKFISKIESYYADRVKSLVDFINFHSHCSSY
eukprot:TRINITY_DN12127_c0_g1_i2.p1 TRINITY_DN12127_c0_g1~~TRINITY_DN12127_c0_g1_i2.p1  ORF type:complete len:281 (+),score=78.87 TRINITY_DN12127_c0_g1_i2:420-1262(+)